MKKNRVNWISLFTIIMAAIIFGIIGIGLPDTINSINHFEEGTIYGYFASYFGLCLLFWIFFRDMKITVKRESYFVSLDNFIKKQLIKK